MGAAGRGGLPKQLSQAPTHHPLRTAGFNAPIAGCFFALEVIEPMTRVSDASKGVCYTEESGVLSRENVAFMLLASALATIVSREILQETLAFKVLPSSPLPRA